MLLEGRNGIIFGVANKRSIAWACAQALSGAGARLAFTYQTERLRGNVEELTATLGGEPLLSQCDVQKPEEIAETFRLVGGKFGRLDFLIHSLALSRLTRNYQP
jgi:enoyl-[acyl-carrier protein] reductase I